MELFAKSKNRLYLRLVDLSHELARRGTMSLSEIHRFLTRGNLVVEGLVSKWLDLNSGEFLSFLVEVPNGEYKMAVEGVLPVLPSIAEYTWLRRLVAHRLAPVFLDEGLIEKLTQMLGAPGGDERFLEVRGEGWFDHDLAHLRSVLRVLLQASQGGQMIRYSSRSQGGQVFADKEAHVLRLEYSLESDLFYVVLYPTDLKRPVKVMVHLISEIELSGEDDAEDWELVLRELRAPEPLVLEVRDVKGTLERAFLLLSCFERQALYDRDRDIHVIRLFYYRFDEALLLSRIYSLGEYVLIRSPRDFREKFIARLGSDPPNCGK
ncbi:MAG: hypothetical protein GX249_08155 [Firmicutes bacterium]|nr:hypothetical protein [Bacillota bacterium]